jgi:hypothetical protein
VNVLVNVNVPETKTSSFRARSRGYLRGRLCIASVKLLNWIDIVEIVAYIIPAAVISVISIEEKLAAHAGIVGRCSLDRSNATFPRTKLNLYGV